MSISLPGRSHATIPQPKQRDSHSGQLADDRKAAQVTKRSVTPANKTVSSMLISLSSRSQTTIPQPKRGWQLQRTGNGRDNPIRQVICLSWNLFISISLSLATSMWLTGATQGRTGLFELCHQPWVCGLRFTTRSIVSQYKASPGVWQPTPPQFNIYKADLQACIIAHVPLTYHGYSESRRKTISCIFSNFVEPVTFKTFYPRSLLFRTRKEEEEDVQ